MNEIASERVNVTTLEDPVERKLGNMHVNQVQISERRGMTFEKGLEALLRQDPDVILLGEIRNSETAKLAAHAAMT